MDTGVPNAGRRQILKRGALGAASVAAVAVTAGALLLPALERLVEVAAWLEGQLGRPLEGQVYKAGVFAPVAAH